MYNTATYMYIVVPMYEYKACVYFVLDQSRGEGEGEGGKAVLGLMRKKR